MYSYIFWLHMVVFISFYIKNEIIYKTNVRLLKILRFSFDLVFISYSVQYTTDTANQQCEYNRHRTVYHFTYIILNAPYLNTMSIKIQPDATVCRYLFTAKSLYMLRVSQHQSSGVLEAVTAACGTGHNIGTATSLRGLIRPCWREVAVPIL